MGSQWYDSNFSIYDDDDQKRILKEILKEDLGDSYDAAEVKKVHGAISRYKNTVLYEYGTPRLQTPEIALQRAEFADEEKRAAMKECGMITLRMDGIQKALDGHTTLEQAVGVSSADD